MKMVQSGQLALDVAVNPVVTAVPLDVTYHISGVLVVDVCDDRQYWLVAVWTTRIL